MKNLYSTLIAVASSICMIAASHVVKRADGNVGYTRADTAAADTMSSPPSDTCILIPGGATELSNNSDATAFLYSSADCKGENDVVDVGATWNAPPGMVAQGISLGSAP